MLSKNYWEWSSSVVGCWDPYVMAVMLSSLLCCHGHGPKRKAFLRNNMVPDLEAEISNYPWKQNVIKWVPLRCFSRRWTLFLDFQTVRFSVSVSAEPLAFTEQLAHGSFSLCFSEHLLLVSPMDGLRELSITQTCRYSSLLSKTIDNLCVTFADPPMYLKSSLD